MVEIRKILNAWPIYLERVKDIVEILFRQFRIGWKNLKIDKWVSQLGDWVGYGKNGDVVEIELDKEKMEMWKWNSHSEVGFGGWVWRVPHYGFSKTTYLVSKQDIISHSTQEFIFKFIICNFMIKQGTPLSPPVLLFWFSLLGHI